MIKQNTCAVTALGLLLWLVAPAGATEATDTSYQAITARNVFGLSAPAPSPEPVIQLAKSPRKLTLNGISTILGTKRALLKAPPPPAKPGEPSKSDQYFMLGEGQVDGDLKVLEIDAVAGSVKVLDAGQILTISFPGGPSRPTVASLPIVTPAPLIAEAIRPEPVIVGNDAGSVNAPVKVRQGPTTRSLRHRGLLPSRNRNTVAANLGP